MVDIDAVLKDIAGRSVERFAEAHAILSFSQFLQHFLQRPYSLTRNAAQYMVDMMDYFGTEEVRGIGGAPIRRFKVFDDPLGKGERPVIGHEEVHNRIYSDLREFVEKRKIDRMILLHGPNGSAKTTIVQGLMRGLEAYSETEEGMLLRFNWIFSSTEDRGARVGFDRDALGEELDTFAFLGPDDISAKIPCELNENPVFLIPSADRRRIFDAALETAPQSEKERFVWTFMLKEGSLSPKSRKIYEALMRAYKGDWLKVMRHVQVERFFVSHRYRTAAVTIDPQRNIDAATRAIAQPHMNGLPPLLTNEKLLEAEGDLVDASRGIVDFSDFLKRPIEANKYLLTTAETGTVHLPGYSATLDLVLFGTSNENYLSAFRREPLFSSFNARLDLVRVPYLLRYSQEEELYRMNLDLFSSRLTVAPHTLKLAALWAVMTRLMQPTGTGLEDETRELLLSLSPLEKAKLYDHGEIPSRMSDADRGRLLAQVGELVHEYDSFEAEFEGIVDAAYEGRRGCSPREMLTMIAEIALDPPGGCLTPLLVLRTLPELIKSPGLFQFLRLQPTRNGYHDCRAFIDEVRDEYLQLLRHDVEVAAEIVDETEYQRLFERYFHHVRAHKTREKVVDETTGELVAPDEKFLREMEELLGAEADAEEFRSDILTKAASFRLSHPDASLVHEEVFRDLFTRLRAETFRQRFGQIRRVVEDTLIHLDMVPGKLDAEHEAGARRFVDRMTGPLGYDETSLKEALDFFWKNLHVFE